MSKAELSAVRLGLIWRRLDGIVDQVAETFLRAAFSVVVRDNYDMAFSLFDADGRQLTQSKRSIPSFLGTLPRTLDAALAKFPRSELAPGDTIISNNAWIGTGHLNDISMIHPIFRGDRLIAFAASTAHTVDIGGAPSPSAKDCFEEGLCIPICKIVVAGEDNPVVMDFLSENLRQPVETLGDIRAQFAAYRDCNAKLLALMAEEGLPQTTCRRWPMRSSPARSKACAPLSLPCRTARTAMVSTSMGSTKPYELNALSPSTASI